MIRGVYAGYIPGSFDDGAYKELYEQAKKLLLDLMEENKKLREENDKLIKLLEKTRQSLLDEAEFKKKVVRMTRGGF